MRSPCDLFLLSITNNLLKERSFSTCMDLLHHQATMRDDDGEWVCSRCGMVNPSADQPCIPMHLEPSKSDEDKAA